MSDEQGKLKIDLAASESAKHIWIFRKWNGMAVVAPSPAILKGGSTVEIVNKTTMDSTVTFPANLIDPNPISIPRGDSRLAKVAEGVSAYVEYDVAFPREEPPHYAEGGSKPSVIIER